MAVSTVLACSTSGNGRGFRSGGLLAALGSCKSGCSSCFADASEQGVSPRIEVGGLTCFALALRSPGCSCFCLRLDFQVTVSVGGESTLGSSCLPPARGSCRAVGFRQDECRPGASAWACCLWFVALLHVVLRCRAVHRCCVLGCGFPLKISLWSSCLHCVGFQQFGGSGRGFRSSGLLAASGFTQIWLHLVFCRCFRTGCQSSARGGGGSASFALALRSLSRLRLFLVVAFWGAAFLSARIPSSLSFTVLACSTSGAGGAFGADSWLLQVSRKSGCTSLFSGCWCWQRGSR